MASVGWFILIALLALLGFVAGRWAGRGTGHVWRSVAWVSVALVLLGAWTWLRHRPDVAVQVFPANILSYLEGVGGTPVFMFILGIAWARSAIPRQRRVVALGVAMGVFYFINGGFWMLQVTPQKGFAQTLRGNVVMQSQDFSCVPAACATALNVLGIPTTESEMAELTRTRPGTGATLIRAVDGLERRLDGTGWNVELITAEYKQFRTLPLPALTPLQFESSRRHMVTVLKVGRHGVLVADPTEGTVWMPSEDFERVFTGELILFRK